MRTNASQLSHPCAKKGNINLPTRGSRNASFIKAQSIQSLLKVLFVDLRVMSVPSRLHVHILRAYMSFDATQLDRYNKALLLRDR